MSTVINALQWRYATKKFDAEKQLTQSQINVIKEAFNLTATSYGLQPVRLCIIEGAAIKAQLQEISMDQQQVVDASHVLVFCVEHVIDETYIRSYFDHIKQTRATPEDILDPYRDYLITHFGAKSTTEIQDWATKQAYLAMGNLLTVCALEGIDACPMEGFEPEAYNKLLGLDDEGLSSVLVMPIGIRAKDDFMASLRKVRKPVNDMIISF